MRIAVDAMGGDKAPEMPVKGAVLAVKEYDLCVTLVGNEREISDILKGQDYPREKIEVVNTSEVISMDDPAALSVRKKRDSSIVVGLNMHKAREVDAFVSAGNTGAVVCAATLSLRLLQGVDRPGIAVIFPTLQKPSMVIDVGANIDPKPFHLLQYGIMGDAYSRYILKKPLPTVAMLNIGEESTKGTDFMKEAHIMLRESTLNFIGNVEPKEVYKGVADVVVCDGFVGNILLKITESFAFAATELLRQELKKCGVLAKAGALMMLPALKAIKKRIDATEYGGAPLMGVDGRVIIGHGSSSDVAIKNAIKAAAAYVNQNVNEHILEGLNSY